MTIHLASDSRTINELLFSWNQGSPAQAPWVKAGRVLLAIDQTGAEALKALVPELQRRYGAREIMILSGRHGAMEGCFQEDGKLAPDVRAERIRGDYLIDKAAAADLETRLGMQITVVDSWLFNRDQYQHRVRLAMALGQWVIVAWCHSIASMRTVPNGATDCSRDSPRWVSAMAMLQRRVSDVVREDYGWIPGALAP